MFIRMSKPERRFSSAYVVVFDISVREKTAEAIKNGQFRGTGNTGHNTQNEDIQNKEHSTEK
jgi:hypothetical protein